MRDNREPLKSGTSFGPYIIGECIGVGGSGLIYTTQHDCGRSAVIKEFFPANISTRSTDGTVIPITQEFSPYFEHIRKSMEHEASLSGNAGNHSFFVVSAQECIVQHDGNLMGVVYPQIPENSILIQDLIQRWNLIPPASEYENYADFGRVKFGLTIIISFLSALSEIHKANILHCDISPCNLLWAGTVENTNLEGHGAFLDFGSAVHTNDSGVCIVSKMDTMPASTDGYGAPELRKIKCFPVTLTQSSDIYSMGRLLCALVNKNFEKNGFHQRALDEIGGLKVPDYIRQQLQNIISRATEENAIYRFQSAEEMQLRCESLLERMECGTFSFGKNSCSIGNQNHWKLTNHIVWPRNLFIGREEEIHQIAILLEENHVLFLHGMGGIGKSEIAKGYAKAYQKRYDTIVFARYTDNLLELVNSNEIPIENLQRSMETETPELFFHRKLQILKNLSSSRTLLIIDNFDVEQDSNLEELINGPYHLLITTRNEHRGYPMLHIEKIQDFSIVRHLFMSNYGRPLSAQDIETVDEILCLVNCHTITVELIAKQMRASFVKPGNMLEMLKNSGTNTKLKEKISLENTIPDHAAFDFIRELFCVSGLSETEQHIMCDMCMVPYTGIEVTLFGQFCNLENYDVINKLISKSWLMLDEETDTLVLHPVIADVVRDQLHPTPLMCRDYVVGLWTSIQSCWWTTTEEKETLAPYLFFLLRTYPEPVPELWQQYGDFGNCAWICGNFELAIQHGHRFYDMTLQEFGPNSVEAGDAATWLAGAYHNSGDNIAAEPYYRLGLEHRLASIGSDTEDVAISYSKLGRCAYLRHDFVSAKEYLETAMEIYEHLDATILSGDTVVEIERMYMEMGDYSTALVYAQESYDVFLKRYGREVTNSAYSLVDIGICCSVLGRYSEAEQYLSRALELNIKFNGQISVQTVRTREAIADNAQRCGDSNRACQLYRELELDLEKDFGSENPQVLHIQEKRKTLNNIRTEE